MAYKILEYEKQSKSLISNGEIEENKAIGLSHDNKAIRPFSNIFFLSKIWTDVGGEISEHPHKGFEILTYVIIGGVEHYDAKKKVWSKIGPGDFELLKARNGINQAVKVMQGSEVIQIWFDPDVRQSLAQEYTCDIVRSNDCRQEEKPGETIKILIDETTDLSLDSEEVNIYDYKLTPGNAELKLKKHKFYTFYIIKGELELNGTFVRENSLLLVKDEPVFEFIVSLHTRFLLIETPQKLSYKTYLQLKTETNS